MKFEKFKQVREKAISLMGLNESTSLKDYRDKIDEAIQSINEADGVQDIGDWVMDRIRGAKSLMVLITRYPGSLKAKNKVQLDAMLKGFDLEKKIGIALETGEAKFKEQWNEKINALPDKEKKDQMRDQRDEQWGRQENLINQKAKIAKTKEESLSKAKTTELESKWKEIEGKNKIVPESMIRKWTSLKAKLDAEYAGELEEQKHEASIKNADEMEKSSGALAAIDAAYEKAMNDVKVRADKAKQKQDAADALAEEEAKKAGKKAAELLAELQPKVDAFNTAVGEYDIAAAAAIDKATKINGAKAKPTTTAKTTTATP